MREAEERAPAREPARRRVEMGDLAVPRPDGEEDQELTDLLDQLGQDLLELAEWLRAETKWDERPRSGAARTRQMVRPGPAPVAPVDADRLTEAEVYALPGLAPVCLEYLARHYQRLPMMDPATGRPGGEIL